MDQDRETPTQRVARAYAAIADLGRSELWITLRPAEEALADAAHVTDRVAAGEELPLAGLTLAVKDNIDVGGLPTTAACPRYAYRAEHSAPAVARLLAAGAVVLGKTNLDQFATGLVGTRSPHGAVRDARRLDYVSGGSSSGSAVAVALGIADIGLGTDTAGSVRVPAAFQGLVGIKPTIGLVPSDGVVPANRSLDCVGVLTRELGLGRRVLDLLTAQTSRAWALDAPLAAPAEARIGVPDALPDLSDAAREAFAATIQGLRDAGHEIVQFEVEPFLDASRLLYGATFMAERYAAVGSFISRHPSKVHPVVERIILAAGAFSAHALFTDLERLDTVRTRANAAIDGLHAVLMPTTVRQPRIDEVEANPIDANTPLGLYSTCANLLDLCAVAVPAGEADGGQFGVTVMGRAFADALVSDLTADLLGEPRPARPLPSAPSVRVRAHGDALDERLSQLGAARVGDQGSWALPPARLIELLASAPGDVELRHDAAGGEILLSASASTRPASDPARAAQPG